MNEQDKNIELIDQYLNDELSGEALEAFEQRLASDAAFREEVALQKQLIIKLNKQGLQQLFAELETQIATEEEIAAKQETNKPLIGKQEPGGGKEVPFKPSRNWYYAIAASVAVALLAGALWLFSDKGDRFAEPQLAQIYYQGKADPAFPIFPSRGAPSTRGEIETQMPVLIYPATDEYNFHYQFADTLRLYGDFNPTQLELRFITQQPELIIAGKSYLLTRSSQILPLLTLP